MEKNRVEAFSDGVIAIAITLLVLDIHVPPFRAGQDLGAALAGQWPGYAAYVVSFVTIGIVWINHHATLRRLSCVDHTLLLLNLLLLLVIGVVPWSTSLFAEYLTEPDGGRLAGVIYGGTMLVMTIVFYTMQHHILFGSHRLTREEIDEADARRVGRRARLGLSPTRSPRPAHWSPLTSYLTLGICALIAVYYALPATVYERQEAPA